MLKMVTFFLPGISVSLAVMGVYFFLKSLEKLACEESLNAATPVAEKFSDAVDGGDAGFNSLGGKSCAIQSRLLSFFANIFLFSL